jgi:glycosyltransferase involved in cell wall biosynthesis
MMARAQVLERLAECDVLVHPSLHDSGGYVCVEAMAAGRPVICLELGGPALLVTEQTGIKIPATSPEQVIRDLAAAMSQLACDPLECERLGESARRRVRENFAWEGKGDFIAAIYNRVALKAAPNDKSSLNHSHSQEGCPSSSSAGSNLPPSSDR